MLLIKNKPWFYEITLFYSFGKKSQKTKIKRGWLERYETK